MAGEADGKYKTVESLKHQDDKRINIPTAEMQSVIEKDEAASIRVAYERRNRDLDPQLVWRGKDEQDDADLAVNAPPIYIQEKVNPKVLIADLLKKQGGKSNQGTPDLFADFNGLPEGADKTEYYQHDGKWQNRLILGDSLQVMASLAEREGMRGKVQCIYIDPPYGIKFNSNFQWSTTSLDVKDGKADHITREPEMVKAFRDTWRDGIHSYLSYLRDRIITAKDLLCDSGSLFVQIGDENVHLVRSVLDQVFGAHNFVSQISANKTTSFTSYGISNICDYVLWYCKSKENLKTRGLFELKQAGQIGGTKYKLADKNSEFASVLYDTHEYVVDSELTSEGQSSNPKSFEFRGKSFSEPPTRHWTVSVELLSRVARAGRVIQAKTRPRYLRKMSDFAAVPLTNIWSDIGGIQSRTDPKIYVVQTAPDLIKRCILMSTDPGDLVLDPTCGSGTTAFVSEQWGRRWITIDTSRVALALARSRIMGARYPYYLLADSKEGQRKEAEITRSEVSIKHPSGNIRHGFVYDRVPHITLKSIANNSEIDVIWAKYQAELEPRRENLNKLLKKSWEEWEIPREVDNSWPYPAGNIHADWWKLRIERQQEIDKSIAAKAEFEYLYDKPYEDKKTCRVAGPFTVESLSPHMILGVDENDELIRKPGKKPVEGENQERDGFVEMILETLKASGVQQVHKEDRINFVSLTPWPGYYICAEGVYEDEHGAQKRAGVFIGPEFGTVSRADLVEAAKEAGDADFDVVIACAFNFDARSSEFDKLGRIPLLKARMNADLHMAGDLKNTGKGNLFVIFGEPDITLIPTDDGQIRVNINGVDVFDPRTGEIRSDDASGIACWFIDTNYDGESFFVRHAYFLGANDPYKSLKTTLKAEINEEAWESLHSDISRPFDKPDTGRIAVKVINHLGDEVMKVFKVS